MLSEVLFHLYVVHFWFEVEVLSEVLYLLRYVIESYFNQLMHN